MNVLLKQAKDIFVVLFGGAGLFLLLIPAIVIVIFRKWLLGSKHGVVVKVKSMMRDRFSRGESNPLQTGETKSLTRRTILI